ncbi:hypothetical protein [Micromonospora auratinigra]|uniref:Uncharacterized protein n=1 Tax=Micromonospora auratinigra TaxID=261654 RepID=A0A1A8Z1V1_9ACTN|nr:hypothetical protein [Micromonospora auratinigra]SBT37860.1 hypothetical protein GA0070611_0355 [Micromonospora auratinigra]
MTVPDELARRLRLARAYLVVEQVEPAYAVLLACDLLAAGVDGDAVVALAIESTRTLIQPHADRLLDAVLTELAVPEMDRPTAARLVTADVCDRLAAGALSVEDAAHQLLGSLAQEPDRAAVDRLLPLLDRLEYDLRGHADAQLRAELLRFAEQVRARPL